MIKIKDMIIIKRNVLSIKADYCENSITFNMIEGKIIKLKVKDAEYTLRTIYNKN